MLKLLVYGQPSSGKTTFLGSFALGVPGRTIWLVCSGGKKPGELRSINTTEHRAKITPHLVACADDFRKGAQKAQSGGYDLVVLDHITGLCDMFLRELLGLEELPAQKKFGQTDRRVYGELGLAAKEACRFLLNLNANVAILAQERKFGGEEDGAPIDDVKPTVGAAVTPSVLNWLAPACDYVVQTYKGPKYRDVTTTVNGKNVVTRQRVKGADYFLRCEPHDVFQTKFRVPKGQAVPDAILDPDYDKFLAATRGELP